MSKPFHWKDILYIEPFFLSKNSVDLRCCQSKVTFLCLVLRDTSITNNAQMNWLLWVLTLYYSRDSYIYKIPTLRISDVQRAETMHYNTIQSGSAVGWISVSLRSCSKYLDSLNYTIFVITETMKGSMCISMCSY